MHANFYTMTAQQQYDVLRAATDLFAARSTGAVTPPSTVEVFNAVLPAGATDWAGDPVQEFRKYQVVTSNATVVIDSPIPDTAPTLQPVDTIAHVERTVREWQRLTRAVVRSPVNLTTYSADVTIDLFAMSAVEQRALLAAMVEYRERQGTNGQPISWFETVQAFVPCGFMWKHRTSVGVLAKAFYESPICHVNGDWVSEPQPLRTERTRPEFLKTFEAWNAALFPADDNDDPYNALCSDPGTGNMTWGEIDDALSSTPETFPAPADLSLDVDSALLDTTLRTLMDAAMESVLSKLAEQMKARLDAEAERFKKKIADTADSLLLEAVEQRKQALITALENNLATYTEIAPVIVDDALAATAYQPEPEPKQEKPVKKTRLPRMLVIGPNAAQKQALQKEFGSVVDLTLKTADETTTSTCRGRYDSVVIWTKFCRHQQTEQSYSVTPKLVGSAGGINEVKRVMWEELELLSGIQLPN